MGVCVEACLCERDIDTEKGKWGKKRKEKAWSNSREQTVADKRKVAFLGTRVTQQEMGSTEPLGQQLYSTIMFLAGFSSRLSVIVWQLKLSRRALQHLRRDAERSLVPAAEAGASLCRLLSQPRSVTLHGLVCSSELVSPSEKWAFWDLSALPCTNSLISAWETYHHSQCAH